MQAAEQHLQAAQHCTRQQPFAFAHRRQAHKRRPHMCQAQAQSGQIVRQVLSRPERTKLNTDDDRRFYDSPRLVKHVDDGFLAQVTQLYRDRIPDDAAVLDLMSSWVSHLPPEKQYKRVVGHGMNAQELQKNPRLDTYFVRNLNKEPRGWALEEQSIDAVLCCVSIQYMEQPEEVFAEIYRVLKPGGVVIITFSNRLFYEKAIAAWRDGSGYSRSQLVKSYFQAVSGFTQPEAVTEVSLDGAPPDPNPVTRLLKTFFARASSDPFYAVIAYRNFKKN